MISKSRITWKTNIPDTEMKKKQEIFIDKEFQEKIARKLEKLLEGVSTVQEFMEISDKKFNQDNDFNCFGLLVFSEPLLIQKDNYKYEWLMHISIAYKNLQSYAFNIRLRGLEKKPVEFGEWNSTWTSDIKSLMTTSLTIGNYEIVPTFFNGNPCTKTNSSLFFRKKEIFFEELYLSDEEPISRQWREYNKKTSKEIKIQEEIKDCFIKTNNIFDFIENLKEKNFSFVHDFFIYINSTVLENKNHNGEYYKWFIFKKDKTFVRISLRGFYENYTKTCNEYEDENNKDKFILEKQGILNDIEYDIFDEVELVDVKSLKQYKS